MNPANPNHSQFAPQKMVLLSRAKRKSLYMTAVVSICFALCWFPYCLAIIVLTFGLPWEGED